jgi:hypothetical protein
VNQGGFIVVHGVDGFALEISTPGGYDAGAAIYRSITVYPAAAQTESAWGPPSP